MRRSRFIWLGAGVFAGAFALIGWRSFPTGKVTTPPPWTSLAPRPFGFVVAHPRRSVVVGQRPRPLHLAAVRTGSAALLDAFWDELRTLRQQATRDPTGAWLEAAALPAGAERNHALAAVCYGTAETDPEDALEMARALDPSGALGDIGEAILRQWAAQDSAAARAWAERLVEGPERELALTRVIEGISQSSPSAAAYGRTR